MLLTQQNREEQHSATRCCNYSGPPRADTLKNSTFSTLYSSYILARCKKPHQSPSLLSEYYCFLDLRIPFIEVQTDQIRTCFLLKQVRFWSQSDMKTQCSKAEKVRLNLGSCQNDLWSSTGTTSVAFRIRATTTESVIWIKTDITYKVSTLLSLDATFFKAAAILE